MNSLKTILFPLLFLLFALLLAGCIETGNKNGFLGEGLSVGDNTPGYHNECQGPFCALVFGEGLDQCQYDEDCFEQPCGEDPNNDCRHTVCINNACMVIATEGPDQCQNNADCTANLAPDFNVVAMARMGESNVILRFTVKNTGTLGYLGPLWHQLKLYKQDSGWQLVQTRNFDASNDNYPVGAEHSYPETYSLSNGDYKFWAFADSNYNANELNENNNENTFYFTVDFNANLDCNLAPFDLSQTWGAFLNSAQNQYEFGASVPLVPNGNSWEGCYYYQVNANSPKILIHPEQQMLIDDGDARMDVINSQVKDLVGYIPGGGDYKYEADFNTAIPLNLDFQNGGYAIIPFMGGRYKVLDINAQSDRINAVKLQNLAKPSEIFWIGPDDYFPNGTTGWKHAFSIGFDGNSVAYLRGFELFNIERIWNFLNPIYPPANFSGLQPNSADFLDGTNFSKEGFAKTWFNGFEGINQSLLEFKKGANVAEGTESPQVSMNSYGAIHYLDVAGAEHYIPMAIYLPGFSPCSVGGYFTFDGIDHMYCVDTFPYATRFALKQNSQEPPVNPDFNIPISMNDTDYNCSHTLKLMGKNNKQYKYLVRRNHTYPPNGVYLVLAGFGISDCGNGYLDTLYGSSGDLFLLGTATNDATFTIPTQRTDYTDSLNNDKRPIYYPDIYDYNGTPLGTYTGIYRTAIFRLREGLGYGSNLFPVDNEPNGFEIYIDTENGNSGTIDTASIGNGTKPNWSGPNTAAWYFNANQHLANFSEYLGLPGENSSNYKKAWTDNGSRIELEERELSMQLPGEQVVVLPENSFVEVKVKPEFDPDPNNKYQIWFERGFLAGVQHVVIISLVKNGETISTINNQTAPGEIVFRWQGEEILAEDIYLDEILYPPYRFKVRFASPGRVFMRMNIKETGFSPLIKQVPVP